MCNSANKGNEFCTKVAAVSGSAASSATLRFCSNFLGSYLALDISAMQSYIVMKGSSGASTWRRKSPNAFFLLTMLRMDRWSIGKL